MGRFAVTVIGHDRPGIIAEVTGVLARLGMNLADSTMTRLAGHFAWVLVCEGPPGGDDVEQALRPVTADGTLFVWVREVSADAEPVIGGRPVVVTVHGGDRPGIVSAVATALAAVGVNITDLTTRLAGDLYVAVAEAQVPDGIDIVELDGRLSDVGRAMNVLVSVREQDTDVL